MTRLGVPLALQRVSEWGNIALLSFLYGKFNEINFDAESPALSIYYLFSTIFMGLAQANGVLVSNEVGKAESILSATNQQALTKNHLANSYKIGSSSIVVSCFFAVIAASIMEAFPSQLTSIFTETFDVDRQELYKLSTFIFRIMGLRLAVDSLRISSSGALRGYKDVVVPPLLSCILMFSSLGLGDLCVKKANLDPRSIFVFSTGGVLLAAAALLFRWKCSYKKIEKSTFAMFSEGSRPSERDPLLVAAKV